MTSLMPISPELSPYLMLSSMLQSNKMGSWDTMPILERRKGTLTWTLIRGTRSSSVKKRAAEILALA
ncbi:hypothetical protein EYF80_028291 [Liparis tanakae]|uniref:Uncharacterized protein n=1 Tax=Liparis tanakae TaxID=230148 RepID=A0A4Z2H715_9TELE|nr:hypothetical protein EYF80_028291 [Liparis tanakae]